MSEVTRPDPARRWPLGRIIGVAVLALLVFSVAAVVAGALALVSLRDARSQVVDVIDPAALQAQQLDNALVNQETGVRGYALSAQQSFLAPYTDGMTEERTALRQPDPAGQQAARRDERRHPQRCRPGARLAHQVRGADHQPGQPDPQARGQPGHHHR